MQDATEAEPPFRITGVERLGTNISGQTLFIVHYTVRNEELARYSYVSAADELQAFMLWSERLHTTVSRFKNLKP